MMLPQRPRVGFVVAAIVALTFVAEAADWPTYRRDKARSGGTSEQIGSSLSLEWVYSSVYAPRPAWSGPARRPREGFSLRHRVMFDDAFQVAAAGGRVYFGSSVDNKVYALDAASGRECWSVFTGGPVRLAPTVWDNKVYVGSDDGFVYCFSAADGSVVWKRRGGPSDEKLLGHGRMISRWPIRTGVLVDGGIAYFGAGIFPHENIYLYAVDAGTGRVIWTNDTISQGGAYRDEFTPQGYMLAAGSRLFIPCGRALPGAFDKATGRMLFKPSIGWRGQAAGGVIGGTYALLADNQVYTGTQHHMLTLDQNSGRSGFGWFPGRRLAIVGTDAYLATGREIVAMDRTAYAEASRKRHSLEYKVRGLQKSVQSARGDKLEQLRRDLDAARRELKQHNERKIKPTIRWRTPNNSDAELVVTADMVFVGGRNRVYGLNRRTGSVDWSADVEGRASGLAVADGRLIVSTDKGRVYCFAGDHAEKTDRDGPAATDRIAENPYPVDELTDVYARAAEAIINESGVTKGYCLVLGAGKGRLACELARRTDLHIIGAEPDASKVQAARKALDAAGLYGQRVVIDHVDLSGLPYSNYFANLIVSDTLIVTGKVPVDAADIVRHLKPCGGVVCLGTPDNSKAVAAGELTGWMQRLRLGRCRISETNGRWAVIRRGALAGAGKWTHQYAEPGNTACSDDRLVGGPLGLLWFGDPGPAPMVNRHNAAAAPLAINGRMFIQGENNVMVYDSYNGLLLWKRRIAGAMRDRLKKYECGNLAASEDSFFVGIGDRCLRLDAETGRTVATFQVPAGADGSRGKWGYTAYVDGILYGSALTAQGVSSRVFAWDVNSGRLIWSYDGTNIVNLTIAIGDGWMFFVDSSLSPRQREAFLKQDKSRFAGLRGAAAEEAKRAIKAMDLRLAVALDARTGGKLWERAVDVTDCSRIGIGGGELSAMYRDGTLVLCGANANGHYWRQFLRGEFSERRLVALSAKTGEVMWARDANYRHRPVIIGDTILAEPWKFELKTGRQITRIHPLTGAETVWQFLRPGHHCGAISACPDMLFMRSGYTSYYDLRDDSGIRHFAGHRLGCWINAIPADGLMLAPEASAGCVCLFPIVCTVVLEPRPDHQRWGIYSAGGSNTPVKHMALNLGAPGDLRADDGTLWIGYPRPSVSSDRGALMLSVQLKTEFRDGGGYVNTNGKSPTTADAGKSWLFGSYARGLKKCILPLLGERDLPAEYDVRLYLVDTAIARQDKPAFDIKLQGQTVDGVPEIITGAGGAPAGLVYTFNAVGVEHDLVIDLVPGNGDPALCAVEVTRRESESPRIAAASN